MVNFLDGATISGKKPGATLSGKVGVITLGKGGGGGKTGDDGSVTRGVDFRVSGWGEYSDCLQLLTQIKLVQTELLNSY